MMKKRICLSGLLIGLLLLLLPAVVTGAEEVKQEKKIPVTTEYFKDKKLLKAVQRLDKDSDGYLSPEEIAKVKSLICTMSTTDVSQLKCFTNLRRLWLKCKKIDLADSDVMDFTVLPKLKSLSLSVELNKKASDKSKLKIKVSGLKYLNSFQVNVGSDTIYGNFVKAEYTDIIDLRNLPSLEYLYAANIGGLIFDEGSSLQNVDIWNVSSIRGGKFGSFAELERLCVRSDISDFTSLDLSENDFLTTLNIHNRYLKEVRLTGADELQSLSIQSRSLESIDVSQNKKLKRCRLNCSGLKSLDVTENKKLNILQVLSKQLDEIDLTNNVSLKQLDIRADKLKMLDIGCNSKLTELRVDSGEIAELKLENNGGLEQLLINAGKLTSLDLSANTKLWSVGLRNSGLQKLDLSGQTKMLSFAAVNNQKLDCVDLPEEPVIKYLTVVNTPWRTLDLSESEWETLDELEIGGDLKAGGLGALPSGIRELTVSDIPWKSFRLPKSGNLWHLTIKGDIKVSVLNDLPVSLENLEIENTPVKSVNLSKLARLGSISLHKNKKMAVLDLAKNKNLTQISMIDGAWKNINLGQLPRLHFLGCENNRRITLDLSGVPKSCEVHCNKNVKVKGFKGNVHRK